MTSGTDEIAYAAATDLVRGYAAGDLSPVEVTEATLARIDRLNSSLVAFVTVTADIALAAAREAEVAYARGTAGPLAGVPISIKDITATRGVRTTRGSLLYRDFVPDEDAPFVERVLAAGAVMLGKTNTPELGWKGDSGNRLVGPTHNPWKHGRTAGGSSGGGAAAVAAGLGPLAQGTDGAGSIRIPASFCGVFGLKPSFGLVPNYPASAVGDLAHVGPMTRTVRDAALLMNATAGADPRDRLTWSSGVDYLTGIGNGIAGLRVAWSPDLGYASVAPGVRAAAERAAHHFEGLGCSLDEAHPDLPDPWDIEATIWEAAMAGVFRGRLDEVRDLLDPGLLRVVERGNVLAAADLAAAQQRRAATFDAWRRFMELYDLLLTPTLPVTAFAAGDDEPDRTDGRTDVTPLDWTTFTYPFNLTGQPAATVPCGFDADGLPVGLQIVGRFHDDATVLRGAAAFEAVAPWIDLKPPVA